MPAQERPTKQEEADFDDWLSANALSLPLIAWGPQHTWIAVWYARHAAAAAVRRTLDEALNSGDGSYRP
jgi:hypothetical protein